MKTNPLERVTPKLSAYGIKVSLTPQDIMAIRKDNSIRLTASPFVDNYEEIRFPSRAAPWKGVKGIENLRKTNPRVAAGLEKAINEYSKPCAGIKGVRRVGGRFLPNKDICQIVKAHSTSPSSPPA